VQDAFPAGWVIAQQESADASRYRVELLDRPVQVVFRPRADAESVAVALASMLSKYLREVCMSQFNRFWARQVPGIQPTAGYPVDARRFLSQIQQAMAPLGLHVDAVWRKK
jgi:ribonuclease HII